MEGIKNQMLLNNADGIKRNLKPRKGVHSHVMTCIRIDPLQVCQECIDLQGSQFQQFINCGSFRLKVKEWLPGLRPDPLPDPDSYWTTSLATSAMDSSTARPAENEDEQDVEMEQAGQEESEEEEEPADENPKVREEEEKKKQAHAEEMASYPKWAHPLETRSKSMPTGGLLNVDRYEGAARIFDNVVMNYLIRSMKEYYSLRVHDDPEAYTFAQWSANASTLTGSVPTALVLDRNWRNPHQHKFAHGRMVGNQRQGR